MSYDIPKPPPIVERAFINQQFAHCDLGVESTNRNSNGIHVALRTSIGRWENAHMWGDYHFALALRKSLSRLGYKVTIQTKQDKHPADAHVLIYLRGLWQYLPQSNTCFNIMWNISHPQDVSLEEYNSFDYIFVASNDWSNRLKKELGNKVDCLLQCTDPDIFKPENGQIAHDLLFVGNSRNVYREVVRYSIELGLDISVYGSGWEGIIDKKYIKSEHVDNSILHYLYSGAKVVLNDHWEDMHKYGFISNRIFDALACNALVLSDQVSEIKDLFDGHVLEYRSADDFKKKVKPMISSTKKVSKIDSRELIKKSHTFDHRALNIHHIIQRRI